MNANFKRVPARFGPTVSFSVRPTTRARRRQEARLEALKNLLLAEQLKAASDVELKASVRGAASEAAALAWVTAYPLLVFPVLFQEKARDARLRTQRQKQVRARTRAVSMSL